MKKTTSVFATVILFLFIISQPAKAITPVEYFCENAFSDMIDYGVSSDVDYLSDSEKIKYYSSEKGNINYNAYSLLNEEQLKLYNAIKESSVGVMSVTVEYPLGDLKLSDFTKNFLSEVMHAVCHDLPQFFYHAGYSASYYRASYQNTYYVTKVIYNFSLISINLEKNDGSIVTVSPTYTESTVESCWSEIDKVLDEVEFDVSNRYNFVKSVHDYLCNNVIYPVIGGENYFGDCHDAYGALVNGYAVCQGYADAFKLICDRYKIPCVFISGTGNGGGHAWNAVQMDDGKWYLIDATWDDQSTRTYYDFFLSGTDTVCSKIFGSTAFKISHINDVDLFLPSLVYATEAYAETEHNTAFEATYNSITKEGNYLIRSFFDVEESFVYYNGMYVDTNGLTTGAEFEVPSGENKTEENWSLVLLGDCTGDGECNYLDYSDAVNRVLSDRDVLTAYDMASDIDCDGYLDVIDLALINIIVNRLDTDINVE